MTTEAKLKVKECYGTRGILDYDPIEDKVQCHICGEWFRGLNNHVFRTHGCTADDYREEFGLNRNQSLICEGTKQKLAVANKKLGLWKHLASHTMTEDELKEFLRNNKKPGWKLRTQDLLRKSKLLREHNPMDNETSLKRRTATLRKTWYGSPRMREISRANIAAGMATVRQRNLHDKKWRCSCGNVFPIREDLRIHKKLNHTFSR